ncbi:ABC-type lipoprotein export system ATPase subunit [Cryobacterium mesophilum]|uniref:ABC transporter ATP-binding protein n=1 Tax=Terrimesophilobacter mesophilus TaxID=433647 RepID=A0A4R8VC43_9MICO|nr:ABC transporter ATP-binding protein [Terrimesophilobacter mesophilus]MBB5632841.1 ABC-type lipoprotein export system ATPase subunit [Terrimesophilobacter mesophilus]TFB79622.1 ABC transporter ATP-binding protein [Terrimesophilobacter mesophilus]
MTTDTAPPGSPRAATGDTEPHILCSDLVRIFAAEGVEVQALQGLNLSVDRGEMVALVGASGSGKSTLLTILSGLDTPTAGVARCAGSDLLTMGRKERVQYQRHSVGFVWQQTSRNLLPYLTAAENVAMAMVVAGNPTKDRRARIRELLDLLEVGYCADRKPTEMSGGEQQRSAIAVALANDPQVLLADEPTGELDEATSSDVLEAMRGVNEGLGITTLIVTHDPAVSEHVNRTIQIRDGRTSTEVLRRREVDEHGQEQHIAEEFAVLDRVGRLQLPDDFTKALELRERVRLALEPDHVGVWPGHRPARSAPDAVADPTPPDAATRDSAPLDPPEDRS